MTPKDILVLKFLSAGPDFHKEERYPAYHFIQIAKADSFSITAQKLRKELPKFEEKDIHYRRAIGIRIVLQGLEASFKRGFRTYGGQKILSSIMISPAKTTPVSARNYMATKIKLLNTGAVRSSPQAQEKICQFRQHDLNTCPACTFDLKKQDKDKMLALMEEIRNQIQAEHENNMDFKPIDCKIKMIFMHNILRILEKLKDRFDYLLYNYDEIDIDR